MKGGWGIKKAKAEILSFKREVAGQYISLTAWSPPDALVSFSGTLTAQAVGNKGNCTSHKFFMCLSFKTHYNPSQFPFIPIAASWIHKVGGSGPRHRMQRMHESKTYRDSFLCRRQCTLERWKFFLVFPEFLPAYSISRLAEHSGIPVKGSPWLHWQTSDTEGH